MKCHISEYEIWESYLKLVYNLQDYKESTTQCFSAWCDSLKEETVFGSHHSKDQFKLSAKFIFQRKSNTQGSVWSNNQPLQSHAAVIYQEEASCHWMRRAGYCILRRVPRFISASWEEGVCLFELLSSNHFNEVYEIYYLWDTGSTMYQGSQYALG